MDNKYKCKLPKFKVQDVVSLQDVSQQIGWGITAFDLPKAWDITQGEDVKIAVLDTGCDLTHPDLEKNLLPGINLINKKLPPIDDAKHGTHVTGIIIAENNDIGMVGVAPKAKVMPVKILDAKGNGDLNNVAIGIRWAVDNGADLISMSLGCPNPLQNVRKAIQYAESKGVVTFVAAGNMGITKELMYPANYKETISVGSIDENFDRSKFSNTGENLDFVAPGGSIFSTIPKDWYAILSGTSMACPFVTGIAALCLSWQRKNKPDNKLDSAEKYRELFRKHTIDINNKKYADKKIFQGYGILDPRKLLSIANS
jgi:serine protease